MFLRDYYKKKRRYAKVKMIGSSTKNLIEKITWVDRKDYLGLTLDEKLKWDKQVHEMCRKISSAVSGIKLGHFLPVDALKKLHNSLVESRLRYCCTVWGNCGEILKNKLSLQAWNVEKKSCDNYGKPDCIL